MPESDPQPLATVSNYGQSHLLCLFDKFSYGVGKNVIIRVFRVKIRKGRLADFKRLVQKQSIPWLNGSDGMLGCIPGEPFDEDQRKFIMISMWRDLDSLKKFAGKDWANPVVTEDEAPLVESMSAEHFLKFDQKE